MWEIQYQMKEILIKHTTKFCAWIWVIDNLLVNE